MIESLNALGYVILFTLPILVFLVLIIHWMISFMIYLDSRYSISEWKTVLFIYVPLILIIGYLLILL